MMLTEVALSLIVWVSGIMGYQSSNTLPTIRVVSLQEQQDLNIDSITSAVYILKDDHTGEILLTQHVDINTIKGQSFIVHELVHYIQDQQGLFKFNNCTHSSEKQAYEIQNKFLEIHHLPHHASKEFISLVSMCLRVTDK